ncbi:hypothetical protein KUH03_17930 [Sphingobacterium sp. E70]|uniref:hypothetical protein n=1 Tax=Sphingobacterium sp. E70 TaxID=2853439 RepID=UPI00211D114B|nr:hypothetical protein [Sphingobacterium sp. E70]ULT28298.1 hypothetical protein KUH03_17930 [Sphingobacterium sp. E70]
MNIENSLELSQTRYRIADLIFEFNHPTPIALNDILGSFRDFQIGIADDKADITINISLEKAPVTADMGLLRTDESIAWEIAFVFMRKRTHLLRQ